MVAFHRKENCIIRQRTYYSSGGFAVRRAGGSAVWGRVRFGNAAPGLGFAVLLLIALSVLTGRSATAQDGTFRESIVVFGDSQAQGVAGGLQRVSLEDPRFRVLNRTHPGAALVHSESEWLAPVRQFVAQEKADIAVVMFGANDRLDMRDDDGGYLRFKTDEWRDAYARRIDKILALLTESGVRVMWCGNPIARSGTYSADMSYINDIYADETLHYGAQFLPLWTAVVDDQGKFTAYGKDRDGVTQRLRNDDGIHFTAAGYALIADKIISLLPSAEPNRR
jgi:hypothetical protein